ncbi:hypothetical protein C8Q80DRAFT_1270557 [Daedaleopsis nitida]|nr:hypothetical protein C8Q80DRAFT_1270557 [Daedaleopsis nitida]
MSSLAAAAFSAFIFSVRGQTTNAQCKSGNEWSPCLMAAYIMGSCEPDGNWDLQALPDVAFQYRGPTADEANECTCSSVAYALSSACGFCQGAGWPEWSATWTKNCPPELVHNGSFPHPIPRGTRIPEWAFVPIAGFLDEFDGVQAMDKGDELESTGTATPTGSPGSSPSLTAATTTRATHSGNGIGGSPTGSTTGTMAESESDGPSTGAGTSPSTMSPPGTNSIHVAPIVGGVIGGLVVFAIIAGLLVYFLFMRRRQRHTVASFSARGMVQAWPEYAAAPTFDVNTPSSPSFTGANDPFEAKPASPGPIITPTPSRSPVPTLPRTPPLLDNLVMRLTLRSYYFPAYSAASASAKHY